jgi:hypothetical protein
MYDHLKKYPGRRFHSDAEVKQAVWQWLHSQNPQFHTDVIHAVTKWLNIQDDYTDKQLALQYVRKKLPLPIKKAE